MPTPVRGGTPAPASTSDPRSDHLLARRAGLGDKAAFAVIFERHGASLHRYALRMLDGDHQAAEDAVQDSLTKAWLNIESFRGEAKLQTWLFKLTANECLSSRRRRRPVVVDDQLLDDIVHRETGSEPHHEASANELRQMLDLALSELPWRQRAAWLLREMEGLSYEEIAEILHTSTTVVRGQLHRARAALKVRMAAWQ